jgi:aquaporin Z
MHHFRILIAELIGTMVLLMGGPGTAILATGRFPNPPIPGIAPVNVGILGVSLAFGLALLVLVYAIGPVSGCHINPAVTVGLILGRKVAPAYAPAYLIGQAIGAVAGALVIWLIATDQTGFEANDRNFAVNGWDELSPGGFGFGAMVVVEIALTALLVFVVLSSFQRGFTAVQSGVTIGLTLALIHLISIPVDNTSVNPARSFGVAVFAGGEALEQLWAFIVFPIIGAVVGFLLWLVMERTAEPEEDEKDLLSTPGVQA